MGKLRLFGDTCLRAVPPALLALAGCTMPGPHAGTGGMHGHMHTDDTQAMCEHHRKEMAGKTPAEQQRMMDEHMRSMTPEMRERARKMHEKCQPS